MLLELKQELEKLKESQKSKIPVNIRLQIYV